MTGLSGEPVSVATLEKVITALEAASRQWKFAPTERQRLAERLRSVADEIMGAQKSGSPSSGDAGFEASIVYAPGSNAVLSIVFDDKPPRPGAGKICEFCKRPLP